MGAAYYFHITGVVLLIIVVMAIACYAMTLATVMWVIISEIFPNRIRGVAMSVCTFALWAACFILTYTFPMLNSGLGAAGTFWLYGLICQRKESGGNRKRISEITIIYYGKNNSIFNSKYRSWQ